MRHLILILLLVSFTGCLFSSSSEKQQNQKNKKKLVLPRRGDKISSQEKSNRTVFFSYDGNTYHVNLSFENGMYDFYKSKPKTLPYEIYSTEFTGHTYLKKIADKLKAIATKNQLDNQGLAELTMAFVQEGFPYTADPENNGYDYPKFPIELFVDGGGDCEDKCCALSSLLSHYGFDVVLVRLPRHMALGINCKNCDGGYYEFDGKRYAFIESTQTGWQIATIPDEFQSSNATLIRVPESPYDYTGNR